MRDAQDVRKAYSGCEGIPRDRMWVAAAERLRGGTEYREEAASTGRLSLSLSQLS